VTVTILHIPRTDGPRCNILRKSLPKMGVTPNLTYWFRTHFLSFLKTPFIALTRACQAVPNGSVRSAHQAYR